MLLFDVTDAFDKAHIKYAMVGVGLQSRLPIRAQGIIKMRKEYIENRNLVAWSFVDYKNPSRQVDINNLKEKLNEKS